MTLHFLQETYRMILVTHHNTGQFQTQIHFVIALSAVIEYDQSNLLVFELDPPKNDFHILTMVIFHSCSILSIPTRVLVFIR